MLKNISKIVSPDLIKTLCEMGHGDEIVIADGNDERVLTPHSRVSFSYEEEGREWSDGCVCNGHEYYALITWE